MVARLSEDLVSELERNGDQPLAVENPRTNRLYVLVAMDKYICSPSPTGERPVAAEITWNEEYNARRFALIQKESAAELTPDESLELAALQSAADEHLRRVAPLPWNELQELHGKLLRLAAQNGQAAT
jgi:hypothetical protein